MKITAAHIGSASFLLLPLWAVTINGQTTTRCSKEKIQFDPFLHKKTYTVGVHATRGLDSAYQETYQLYGEYLTKTAGATFDPPIAFEVKPALFDDIFKAIYSEEMDFLYANPGIYSCVGTEVGATSLVTVTKHLEVRGEKYDLDVYGGVMATRRDNNDINTIADLKDKVIGAGAIIDLMGGQMQIYEMERAGMSFVNDPKQVVFTKDQRDVVLGLLDGTFDVGFIRTDQIEVTKDGDGNHLDPDLFKVIEPKIYVMDSGSLFPFLHSTDIFPEWPLASLPAVPKDVQLAVQEALIAFGEHAEIGKQCNSTQGCNYDFSDGPCDGTDELAKLSREASLASHVSMFRTSRSYHELRTMQEKAGFLVQDEQENWYCTRPSSLYEGITCPEGYFRRSETEFHNGCGRVGLDAVCNSNDNYDCFCKPCVEAFEVDVYEHSEGEDDLHVIEYYGDSLPGCEKMEICATIRQGETTTLRIYDNMMRDNAKVEVIAHAADSATELPVTQIDGTHAYEFSFGSKRVQVQVIEIRINGEPISQSPIRLMVEEAECFESHREPSSDGTCVCANNTYEIAGTCVESPFFFLIIFSGVFVAMSVFVFMYLGYKKQQNDQVWHVNVDELHFNEPPEVIGQGGFGVVVLGQYRGTKVAVKRVLPPDTGKGSSKGGRGISGNASGSIEVDELTSRSSATKAPKKTVSNKDKDTDNKNVKFSGPDIEEGGLSLTKSGTKSASNKDWEDLLHMRHSNNVLKILESATASNHGPSGSDGMLVQGSYTASRTMVDKYVPLGLRFDAHSRLKKEFINEMRLLSRLRHPCITTVMGAVIAPTVDPMLVMEYMEYGSLYDLLHNETMTAGGEIILQIVRDIVQGIQFLHASKPPILHGDLKAKNILVDSRFRAKVADFGFSHFKNGKQRNLLQGTPFFMSPEYLRGASEYTAACDVYALGMIFYEIYARKDPFDGEDPRKVLPKICHPRINKRPPVPESMPPKIVDVMKKCWSANPFFRPTAKDIDYVLVEINAKEAEPLMTKEESFKKGVQRKPTSLYDVFPKHIADALNAGKKVEAESHEIVTVVFSDIVGFTTISQTFSPLKVSTMLDRLYQAFDSLAGQHNIFKVETIGDAYMGVTNLDGSEFDTHVKQIAEFAQDAIAAASTILIDEDAPEKGYVKIRVGFHSGPVVSNVIGSLNPRYGLFGDTVNTASRMESNSVEGHIHCTFAAAQLLQQQAPDIPITLRGKINVKGKGKMRTYWVGKDRPDMPHAPLPFSMPSFSENNTEREDTHREEDDQQDNDNHSRQSGVTAGTHDVTLDGSNRSSATSHRADPPTSHVTRIGMDGTMMELS